MTSYTWIGNKGTNDANDATQSVNWTPSGVPGSNDTVTVGLGATLDNTTTGGATGLTLIAAGTDTFNFSNQMFIASSFTLGDKSVLNLTGYGVQTAGFDLNNSGNNGAIHQSGTGSALTINAIGNVSNDGFTFLDSPGGSLTVNVTQTGSIVGDYFTSGPLFDLGGTLTLNSDNSAATGVAGNRVSNAGYILIDSQNALATAKFNARMDGVSGVTELVAGAAGAALLEINTNMPGAQIVEFGSGTATVQIDGTNTLPAYANVGTLATTVLQNQFERFNIFAPGDTIDLAGLSPTNLTYSFGNNPTYGNNVLTLSNGSGVVARLRFTNSTGFVDGSNSNFILTSDGAGGTAITVSATPINVVNAGTTYAVGGTPASFIGPLTAGTVDWAASTNWTGGILPGTYQTAQITNSTAQLNAFQKYVLTVSSATAAGGLSMDDHFATLQIGAALTLKAAPGQGSGGGITETAGTIDIGAGGTVTAANLLQVNGAKLSIEAGGKLTVAGNTSFATGAGLRGLEIEDTATLDNGTIASGGAIAIGQNASAQFQAANGSAITASYTQVGSAAARDTSQPSGTSYSTLTITGAATVWRDTGGDASTPFSGALIVGGASASVNATGTTSLTNGGQGSVDIDQGATLIDSAYAMLGATQGSFGTATVQNGAHWTVNTGSANVPGSIVVGSSTLSIAVPALLSVGQLGSGVLQISSGGTVTLGSEPAAANQYNVVVGNGGPTISARASGTLTVDAGLLDSSNGVFSVGQRSDGTATVTNGGTILAGAGGGITFGVIVGSRSYVLNGTTTASTGTLSVGGNAGTSLIRDTADFVDGRDGVGHVTLSAGGSIAVSGSLFVGGYGATAGLAIGQGSTFLTNGGSASVAGNATIWVGNTIDVEGTGGIEIGGTTAATGGALVVDAGHVLAGSGRIVVNSTSSSLQNSGTVSAYAPLTIDANAAGSGLYTTAIGGTLTFNRTVASTANVQFGGGSGTIALANPTGFNATIGNFGTGYALDILGYNPVGASVHWTQTTQSAGSLSVSSTSGTLVFNISGLHASGYSVASDGKTTAGLLITANAPIAANRILDWTGTGGTTLSAAGNWNDITDSLSPATLPPAASDQAAFLAGGGALTGTLIAAGLTFGGGTVFSLANNANVSTTGTIAVGQASPNGDAQLSVLQGSTLATGSADIAPVAGADGSQVSVNGTGSTWQITNKLTVGDAAAGSLAITAGGTVTAASLDAAAQAGGSAIVSVNGAASRLTIAGQLTLGDTGAAGLSVYNAGTVTATDADIGLNATGSGNIDLEGAGSRLDILDNLNIGDAGLGVVTVGQGATLTVVNNLNQGANGILTIAGGVVDPASGTITGATTISSNGVLQYTNTLTLKGQIVVQSGGGTLELAHITGNGTLVVGTNGTMVLADGTGGTGGPLFVGATVPTIAFSDVNGTLVINDIAGLTSSVVISGFSTGDQIQVGTAFASMSYAGGVLTLYSDVGQSNPVGTLFFSGSHTLSDFQSAVTATACYAEGTRILTARGEIPVEHLREGDALPTLLHGGGVGTVRWLGVSTVDLDRHPEPDRAAPIRVQAGALAQGVPHRDLVLSPEHALLLDGQLVPVHLLVNGASIRREAARGVVRYHHVELDHHDAILAEGAAAETYLDTGNRAAFDNAGTLRQLHPMFDAPLAIWAEHAAAPLLLEGDRLAALHARLARRAEKLGHARTGDAGLTLRAGDTDLPMRAGADGTWTAHIPPGTRQLRLCSRSFVPSALNRMAEDHRRLGVMLADIRLNGAALPANAYGPGFHQAEDGAHWTNGDATLNLPTHGTLTLQVLMPDKVYWAAA